MRSLHTDPVSLLKLLENIDALLRETGDRELTVVGGFDDPQLRALLVETRIKRVAINEATVAMAFLVDRLLGETGVSCARNGTADLCLFGLRKVFQFGHFN